MPVLGLSAISTPVCKGGQADSLAATLHLIASLPASANQPAPLEPDAFNCGLGWVDRLRVANPKPP
jgi:hypothetical protein